MLDRRRAMDGGCSLRQIDFACGTRFEPLLGCSRDLSDCARARGRGASAGVSVASTGSGPILRAPRMAAASRTGTSRMRMARPVGGRGMGGSVWIGDSGDGFSQEEPGSPIQKRQSAILCVNRVRASIWSPQRWPHVAEGTRRRIDHRLGFPVRSGPAIGSRPASVLQPCSARTRAPRRPNRPGPAGRPGWRSVWRWDA